MAQATKSGISPKISYIPCTQRPYVANLSKTPPKQHARNVRLIGESRRKDDRLDAQTLARLARIDPQLLCPLKHRSAKPQADLTVIRARAGLVRVRTALVNTARVAPQTTLLLVVTKPDKLSDGAR